MKIAWMERWVAGDSGDHDRGVEKGRGGEGRGGVAQVYVVV